MASLKDKIAEKDEEIRRLKSLRDLKPRIPQQHQLWAARNRLIEVWFFLYSMCLSSWKPKTVQWKRPRTYWESSFGLWKLFTVWISILRLVSQPSLDEEKFTEISNVVLSMCTETDASSVIHTFSWRHKFGQLNILSSLFPRDSLIIV